MDYAEINKLAQSNELAWSVALAGVGIIVIAINSMTLLTFVTSPSLQSRKHIIVINLAVADLLFGAAGIPSAVIFLLKPTMSSYYFFQSLNAFSKMASLFTLGAIAVERMHAIVWPIRHRVLPSSIYKMTLVLIWALSFVMTTIVLLNLAGYGPKMLKAFLPFVIFCLVITIMVCYTSIWISVRRQKRRKLGAPAKQDKALAVTLLLVAGTFIIAWSIPMQLVSISRICRTCYKPSVTLLGCIHLFFAVQSTMNPVIYCFRLSRFKERLKETVKCSKDGRRARKIRQITIENEMGIISGKEAHEAVRALRPVQNFNLTKIR